MRYHRENTVFDTYGRNCHERKFLDNEANAVESYANSSISMRDNSFPFPRYLCAWRTTTTSQSSTFLTITASSGCIDGGTRVVKWVQLRVVRSGHQQHRQSRPYKAPTVNIGEAQGEDLPRTMLLNIAQTTLAKMDYCICCNNGRNSSSIRSDKATFDGFHVE